jgi:hypothetical protein
MDDNSNKNTQDKRTSMIQKSIIYGTVALQRRLKK